MYIYLPDNVIYDAFIYHVVFPEHRTQNLSTVLAQYFHHRNYKNSYWM